MSTIRNRTDKLATRIARSSLAFRIPIIVAALALVAVFATGLPRLTFDTNYRAFFSTENPELAAFEEFQGVYTKNDNFLVVVRPMDGEVFTQETLAVVEHLTEAAWQTPYTLRVDSITNFQSTRAEGDNLIVEDLVHNALALSDQDVEERRAIALNEPLLNGQLVTADGSVTAINLVMQYPELSVFEVPEAAEYLRDLRDIYEADYPNIRIDLSGISMLNNAFMESGMSDMMTLVPLMYGVLLLLVIVAIRSWSGTFATLLVIMFSTLVAMGAAGFMKIGLTPVSASAPTVILTLAIADSIHILMAIRDRMREGSDKAAAIIEAIRTNFLAVTITSVTTIIGFMALNLSDSPPFGHLGTMTAIGIAAAWAFSLLMLPAVVSLLPMKVRAKESGSADFGTVLDRFGGFIARRSRLFLVGTLGVSALLIALMPRIELNDQWVNYFDQRMEVRQENDIILEHFGLYPVEFSVPAESSGGVSEPEYLEHLDAFASWARSQPNVTHVYSFTDVMRRLNMNLHEDDPAYFRLPDEREQAAQYLLLYELSLPYGLDLNDRINIDKSATRLTVTLANVSTAETKAFFEAAQAWLVENTPTYMHTDATGASVMFAFVAERNVTSMISGNIVAVLAICLVMALALRSLGLGMLSLIPNALPILVTFGVWAVLVGSVGFSVAAVGAVSLGIVVDDTVHFLTKYRRARVELAYGAEDAIRYAFRTVGAAIVVNSIVLAAGFAVLAGSTFRINADLGLLTALAIGFALVLDFLLLPALLMELSRLTTPKTQKGETHVSSYPQPAE